MDFRICIAKFMPVVWTINVGEKELSELEASRLTHEKKRTNKRGRQSMKDSPCAVEKVLINKRQKTRGRLSI